MFRFKEYTDQATTSLTFRDKIRYFPQQMRRKPLKKPTRKTLKKFTKKKKQLPKRLKTLLKKLLRKKIVLYIEDGHTNGTCVNMLDS